MNFKAIVFLSFFYFLSICSTAWTQTVTVKYGMIPSSLRSVSSLPLYVAEKRGFFMAESGELKEPLPKVEQFADTQFLHAAGIR